MSNAHLTWARNIRQLSSTDRSVLLLIADRVRGDGTWQYNMRILAEEAEITRNTLRACLDRLLSRKLLALRAERYRGQMQAAHMFCLVRDENEERFAIEYGFSFARQIMRRDNIPDAQDTANRSFLPPQGRSIDSPIVGQISDQQEENNPYINPSNSTTGGKAVMDQDQKVKEHYLMELDNVIEAKRLCKRFLELYPLDPLDPNLPAERQFLSLTPYDQRAAIDGLVLYLAEWKTRGRVARHIGKKKWLVERRWENFSLKCDITRKATEGIRIYEGTEEHQAWAAQLRREGKSWIAPLEDKGRRYCIKPSQFP